MTTRNTAQKDLVASIIMSACDHPTAEVVHQRAKEVLPNISLGTVYRILKQLEGEGRILELVMQNAPSRFDGNVHPHAHFLCEKCGKYVDFDMNLNTILSGVSSTSGALIQAVNLSLSGLCEECKEN